MELCSYKRGLWSCRRPRRKSNSTMIPLYCDKHYTNANRKNKLKSEKKKAITMTNDAHENNKVRVNSQSRDRNRAYRNRRREILHKIVDAKVKAIASRLDTIKDGQHYVIIPNVVSNLLTVDDIVREGDIDFKNPSTSKTQQDQSRGLCRQSKTQRI